MPTPEQVLELPALIRLAIPSEWQDHNGHVNVQHYVAMYDRAGWPMLEGLGIDAGYFERERRGIFDLEHHIWYLAEAHVGDEMSAHVRYVARSAKRLHGVIFLYNATRRQLACAVEWVATGADLDARRTAPWPESIAAALDGQIAGHSALDWPAPSCGTISA